MGMLDDAIREHLELKRLRGADAAEVAREQREALDPVLREEPVPEEIPAEPADLPQAAVGAEPETAELDMETVLAGEGERGAEPVQAHAQEGRSGWNAPGPDGEAPIASDPSEDSADPPISG